MADYDCQSYIDRYPLLQKKFGTSCDNEETRTKAYEHWTNIGSKEGLIAAYADNTAMDTNMLYILNKDEINWNQHNAAAKGIGSNLASIHNITEDKYIRNMVKDASDYISIRWGAYFIGGERINNSRNPPGKDACCWKWSDGSKWDFYTWYGKEPNNNGITGKIEEDGVNGYMHAEGWNDLSKQHKIIAIYKKPIPHSNSVTFPNTGTKEFMYKSKLIDEILKDKRFEINVDLKISGAQPDARNVFHYGNTNEVRVPAMWVYPKADNKWIVHFVASSSAEWTGWKGKSNSHMNFYIPDKFRNFGETLRIKVQFYEMDNSFLLVAYVNGEEVKIQEFEGKFYRKEEQILRIQDTRFHKRNGVEVSNLTFNKFQPQVFDLQAILDRNIQQKQNQNQKEEFSNYSIGKEEMSSMTTKTSMQPAPVQRPLQSGQPTLEGMSIIEGNTNPTISGILTHQNDVRNIVEHETERLNAKKAHIDGVLFSQKRELDLNESHRLKHRYYLYIFIILVCAMVAYILVAKLRESLTFIPDMVFDIMVILTIIIPGFLIYFAIIDIRRRDHMDFSKLNLHAPKQRSEEEINAAREKAVKDGDLSALTKLCSGEECCPADGSSGATWNAETGRCVPRQT